jgi:hypothetical protein
LEEREPFFQFVGDAQDVYQRLDDPDEVMALLAQLLHIADNNQIDNETVFELPAEDDILKIVYGPPFTIVFRNLLNGTLVVYTIRHPAF